MTSRRGAVGRAGRRFACGSSSTWGDACGGEPHGEEELTHTRFRRTRTTGDAYPNYNVREYIRRRAREEFAKQGGGGKSLQAIREDLDVVKRQGAVYALYNRGPVVKSVMDLPK